MGYESSKTGRGYRVSRVKMTSLEPWEKPLTEEEITRQARKYGVSKTDVERWGGFMLGYQIGFKRAKAYMLRALDREVSPDREQWINAKMTPSYGTSISLSNTAGYVAKTAKEYKLHTLEGMKKFE